MTDEEFELLCKLKVLVGETLGLDMPLPGPLAKHAELPLLSHNQPAEFARLREFLMG